MSYANMDGVPTQTAGTSEILASDWNTYVRDNFDSIKFGHIVCTSSTRPTGIAEGTMIYETDTQKVLVYNGSSWVEVSDLDNTGGASDGVLPFLNRRIFTNEAARNAAIPSPVEGQEAYLTASTETTSTGDYAFTPSGIRTIYNGSGWVTVTPVGARTDAFGATTSTSFTTSLSGSPGTNPSVTLRTGTTVILEYSSQHTSATSNVILSFSVSGATTAAAQDAWGVGFNGLNGRSYCFGIINAGVNTFTLNYRVVNGGSTADFGRRNLIAYGIA